MIISMFFWLLTGAATGHFAKQRGRDPVIWFLIGIFLGLLGLLLLFIMPVVSDAEQKESMEGASQSSSSLFEESFHEEEPAKLKHDFLIKDWFYLDETRKQLGPVSFDIIKGAWKEGKIGPSTFLWSEGMENWKKLENLHEMKEYLSAES